MGRAWSLVSEAYFLSGPLLMLMYPLYASMVAIESRSKEDDEQWLAYWILYSFLTLAEMLLQSVLEWVPIWYPMKILLVAWLVLPQFRGAAFLYERFARDYIRRFIMMDKEHSNAHGKGKTKSFDFASPKKVDHDKD